MLDNHQKNIATLIHLSTFTRFFFPLGNFIAPIVLWALNKDKSEFVDSHGKQAINFQISILLYALILGSIAIPLFAFNLFSGFDFINFNNFDHFHISISKPSPLLFITGGLGVIAFIGFIIELILIIRASLTAREGKPYHYPFTINFIK
ncbi:DUF4870 domain-containing protein [Mangrovimonas futianensis]|uniref:DUF4870 domain-containing protein n=1 Tax=Mangrovimonas futianensis TaxID=2895523 RepID=UPI001E3EA542|nr:DUF4870 domain-containing protein [Mangrovimonas futianensis]MCF1422274.1 DUF4870 domain-containing protein [Mangrovimonas futianensis]